VEAERKHEFKNGKISREKWGHLICFLSVGGHCWRQVKRLEAPLVLIHTGSS